MDTPLFFSKSKTANAIIFHENNKIIKDNKKNITYFEQILQKFYKNSQIKKGISCSEKEIFKTFKAIFKAF